MGRNGKIRHSVRDKLHFDKDGKNETKLYWVTLPFAFQFHRVILFIIVTFMNCWRNGTRHSMGCAIFFVAMINHPELNEKIEVMMALAPATSLANMKSPIRYFAPFVTPLEVCTQFSVK